MPPVNSKVFLFPQGHAEYAHEKLDSENFPRIPALVLCRVSGIKFLADTDTDEVYAKIRLVPLRNNDSDFDHDDGDHFPTVDYSAEPPVQTILAKDVHGEIWKFRHIYRGIHNGSSSDDRLEQFCESEEACCRDSIVFLRADNGDLCRLELPSKEGIGDGPELPSRWNTVGIVLLLWWASPVRTATRIQWYPGMRFKMAFETEDSSLYAGSWGLYLLFKLMTIRWPNSPWRFSRPSSPLCCVSNKCFIPAGIQEPGMLHFGLSSADFHFNKLHWSVSRDRSATFDHAVQPPRVPIWPPSMDNPK
ncbi:Auxin response factor 16 [Camellia lanceoleosa]|uniref:Auxin response factor 16 n=1 Tax=Camellia lanceoleosa TaxID=1840588 RepID=A0ACC0GYU4_9ERIC|nr:Auxin response factor 16 [Camellia lanceoleosa]